MQCKLYFFYNNDDWNHIQKHLKEIKRPYRVITNSYPLNEFLNKEGIDSKTLRDIFPEEGQLTYEVYRNSKELQKEYRRHFQNITFNGLEIFSGFENQLLDQIILYEKTRKILEEKKSTVFVFEGFSFTYFSILKLAQGLGYESTPHVAYLHKDRVDNVGSDGQRLQDYKTKYHWLKKFYFPRLPDANSISRKLSVIMPKWRNRNKEITLSKWIEGIIVDNVQNELAKIRYVTIRLDRFFSFAIRLFTFRFFSLLNLQTKKMILNKVNKKMLETDVRFDAECGFFFTTNQEDLYLKSLYPVLDKLKQENIKFQAFSIDLITNSILSRKGISFVNLFEDVNILTDQVKHSKEGRKISTQIKHIAINNNLTLLHVNELSLYLLNEIYRSIAIMIIFEHIISRMKLKSVIIATDGVMYGNSIVTVAKKHGIPSFFIPSTIINSNPLHSDWYHADKICIYGLQGLEVLTGLGYPKYKIILTGSPKYDHLKNLEPQRSKKLLEESYGTDSKKKLIVVGMARWHEKDEDWMSGLIKFCNKNSFEVVIKIHPMYKQMLSEESEEKIKIIRDSCVNLKYIITYDIDLYHLLSAADLVISDYSNVGAEAILLEKPLLTVNFVRESFEHEQRYHESGAAIYLEDYNSLEDIILEILNQNKHLSALKLGRQKIIDRYNFYNDGKATERICELLLQIKKSFPTKEAWEIYSNLRS